MRYWFDTEFIEDGETIDLISIGIVCSDGREYYAINKDCNFSKASSWVLENVLAPMGLDRRGLMIDPANCSSRTRESYLAAKRKDFIAIDVVEFMGGESIIPENPRMEKIRHQLKDGSPKPEIWAYYADYDWVAFCQLFGTMMDLPKGFPMYCRDIKQECDRLGNPELPKQTSGEHNALEDARWNRKVWEFLKSIDTEKCS